MMMMMMLMTVYGRNIQVGATRGFLYRFSYTSLADRNLHLMFTNNKQQNLSCVPSGPNCVIVSFIYIKIKSNTESLLNPFLIGAMASVVTSDLLPLYVYAIMASEPSVTGADDPSILRAEPRKCDFI